MKRTEAIDWEAEELRKDIQKWMDDYYMTNYGLSYREFILMDAQVKQDNS
jgi:hypothetical protein